MKHLIPKIIVAISVTISSVSVLAGQSHPVETLQIQRADDSFITAYIDRPVDTQKHSLLLILQGSICEDVGPHGSDRMDISLPAGFARLDIEKYDLNEKNKGGDDKRCPTGYLQHNSIDQRVIDVLTVIADLRDHAPWWNGHLFLLGTSEGATVAALAGPPLPETSALF